MAQFDGSTMGQIQALSNERQGLWRLAGKRKLDDEQLDRLRELKTTIADLWDQHRREMATARGPLTRKLGLESVADYSDLLSKNDYSKNRKNGKQDWWSRPSVWDETGVSHSKTEYEAMVDIQKEVGAKPPSSEGLGDALADYGPELIREVLREMKAESAQAAATKARVQAMIAVVDALV